MGKNFTSVFAVCLAISALPLACGDDDDGGDGDGSTGGKGGSAGSTSTGGKGGGAGSTSTGGKGGTAGSTSTGGKGGTAGTAGTAGGEGGMGGAEGGMGGEGGGGPELSACDQMCAHTAPADCENEAMCGAYCLGFYEGAPNRTVCDPLFDALFMCWTTVPTSAFVCDGGNVVTDSCGAENDAVNSAGCFG
jgi:hypothetical protein